MRDWNSETRRNRDVLKRIVALLVALADLADLASGLPVFRRRRLLEILIWGEAEALAFVTGMAPDAPTCAPSFDAPGYDALGFEAQGCAIPLGAPVFADKSDPAGDPARLAASLRALALALWSLLAATRQLALPGAAAPPAGRRRPALPAALCHQPPPPAPDTS